MLVFWCVAIPIAIAYLLLGGYWLLCAILYAGMWAFALMVHPLCKLLGCRNIVLESLRETSAKYKPSRRAPRKRLP